MNDWYVAIRLIILHISHDPIDRTFKLGEESRLAPYAMLLLVTNYVQF